ncbi:polysaccharide biosynthesis protein [Clostridium mediterraneense]|uniref:polysaccharide biosynthesis protein n=1 Tax=Clostridium mediterraneense TaxID=1805472 RepID=UPI00082B6DBA|nr:nucleoside-diphosphate sugar epimerase/dehydratase [Clostridium mediterraneense]
MSYFKRFFDNGKKIRSTLLFFADIIAINLALMFSFYIRYESFIPEIHKSEFKSVSGILLLSYLIPLISFKMYRSLWRNAGFDEFVRASMAVAIGILASNLLILIKGTAIPLVIIWATGILIYLAVIGSRLSYRIIRRLTLFGSIFLEKDYKKVLIIGAGAYAHLIIDEMQKDRENNLRPVAIIDDNPEKLNTYLKGLRVLGNRNQIEEIVNREEIDMIVIAISSIDGKSKKEIIEICKRTKVKTKIVPAIGEMIEGKASIKTMRDIDLRDLLGRDEIKLDKAGIDSYIKGKRVLVTGGGGSIGSELCRQISKFNPSLLLILDNYENNAYEIENELNRNKPNLNKRTIIATVREKDRIREIFEEYKPEVVFHAAAHKHVPLMEFSPSEAIKNNAKGTLNVAELALKYEVEKFVLISTDKAVNPTNIMGATKRLCEMVIQGMQAESKKLGKKTEFAAVRFGNVLGSNGSVIPLFKKQIAAGGPVTLTHENITRYFMLIPEAVQLVLQAGAFATGGEIFVLDMGEPVKIYDLARDLIRLSGFEPDKDIEIKVTGLRPGEKLYEELLMDEEGLEKTKHEKIFIGKPGDFDIKEIELKIDELIKIGEEVSKEELKDKMADIVPTYIRETENMVAITEE